MWNRWNPFREMEALRREIDRVFEGYGEPRTWRSAFLPGTSARTYPLVNVSESAEEVVVEALAPGLDVDSLEVSVKGNQLTISGEKRSLEGVAAEAYHRTERSTGRFVRTLNLDTEVDDAKVTAQYANGILLVTLPKSERAKPKQITVNVK
jgi:HSP20 family protein